jgi:apolipoprotein N-acyltransferase
MEVQIMPTNIQGAERFIRVAIGVALLCMVAFAPGNWRWLGLVGFVPLATGLVGWCPLYALLTRD